MQLIPILVLGLLAHATSRPSIEQQAWAVKYIQFYNEQPMNISMITSWCDSDEAQDTADERIEEACRILER